MTITDTDTRGTDAPKPKRKWRRKYKRRTKIMSNDAAPKPTGGEFAGMTAMDCCDACEETHCVITGIGVCGHPMKGALQARLMMNKEVTARYKRAKAMLDHAKLDMRNA